MENLMISRRSRNLSLIIMEQNNFYGKYAHIVLQSLSRRLGL